MYYLTTFHDVLLSLTVFMVIAAPFILWQATNRAAVMPLLILYIVLPLTSLANTRNRIRRLEQDLREVEFEMDLQQYNIGNAETRAEKILRINDSQLQRYYDVNLDQNMWVFCIGVFCILLGLAVIAVTLYILLYHTDTVEIRVIPGILGAIGSLLTSYIAAIYLKIHAATSGHLTSFHSRLVETHQILLSNLVASRIEDQKLREETFAKLALGLKK